MMMHEGVWATHPVVANLLLQAQMTQVVHALYSDGDQCVSVSQSLRLRLSDETKNVYIYSKPIV